MSASFALVQKSSPEFSSQLHPHRTTIYRPLSVSEMGYFYILIPFSNSLRGLIMILEVKQLWILKEKCPHHRQNYYLIYLKTEWMFSAKLKISCLLQEYNRSGHRLLSSCYTTLCESLCISSWNSQMTQENRLLLSLFYREAVGEKRNWVNFTWLTPSWASESHHLQTAGPELPAKAKWVFPLLSAKIPE